MSQCLSGDKKPLFSPLPTQSSVNIIICSAASLWCDWNLKHKCSCDFIKCVSFFSPPIQAYEESSYQSQAGHTSPSRTHRLPLKTTTRQCQETSNQWSCSTTPTTLNQIIKFNKTIDTSTRPCGDNLMKILCVFTCCWQRPYMSRNQHPVVTFKP